MRMATGRIMPVEGLAATARYLFPDVSGHPQVVLILDGGTVVRGRAGVASEFGVTRVEGRESHFARCPGAETFRGGGRTP